MPWFRLDDSFYDNPKVVDAGNAAVGLWVRCATWSARHLTDGRIPADVVRQYGRRGEADAATRVGLWVPGDGDYVVPHYGEYNASAFDVKRRRAADVERKRRQREAVDRDEINGRYMRRGP